ncbi:phage tail assembly chaperone [Pseudomonas sp. 18.1.10]|uniref:phage tail assembly chaperone n=1 Tax=Pseudomonas sp. 18.1.10 TaxID=2969302 RepID=UPI0021503F0E|nr:phage tail assembly chaperone [Pseudomonas sp. 18.1.10]MCR4538340.1 phage tail assembly chaperone [Pseudomonas sp. 18.1.10]
MFYSPSTHGLYSLSLHGKNMPADVIEMSEKEYADLSERGFAISDPGVSPTIEDVVARERAWRGYELSSVKWLRERHRDQLEIEVAPTLSEAQFKELLMYMQALRDWPQSPDFPNSEHRPVAPSWIANQTE